MRLDVPIALQFSHPHLLCSLVLVLVLALSLFPILSPIKITRTRTTRSAGRNENHVGMEPSGLPIRPTSAHHATSTNDTPWRGRVKSSCAVPFVTATEAGASVKGASWAAASSCVYCGRVGATGEPSDFHPA